jgi:hypothetical protein
MITRLGIQSGHDQYPLELEVNVDTVYKRYNIHEIIDHEGNPGYEYDVKEMTLLEYFRDALPENQLLNEESIGELSILIGEYQAQVDNTLAELSILLEEVKERDV